MKTLNDVINAVQHETQLSRSQLSLKIGKSRNYLSEVLRSGVSHEKEQEIIALLLDLVDDEVAMLRRENASINRNNNELYSIVQDLEKDLATKNLFIDGLDMENKGLLDNIGYLNREVKLLNDENEKIIKDSHKIKSKLQDVLCERDSEIARLNKEIDSNMESFIKAEHAQDKEITRLEHELQKSLDDSSSKEKTIQSMKEVMREIGIDADRNHKKNRFLTASIIGLVAIFSVYLWVK